ncbi:hypothetical protein BDV95DRAFT_603617 [Massariosphaeria phaeospora]|uniref:RNase H type-1 domain-containing protein n=1 Tax=Massariosphaeria phaeospora TaxID=100035 RepID=A0A7C8MTX2_9PLEO|nr:hypothetical protein BDV95DRAFT_603617 [Massariosphaeria phaeospora]
MDLYPFPAAIQIQDRVSAHQYSSAVYAQGAIDRCLVMWADASIDPSGLSASAVRYLGPSSQRWKESVTLNSLQYGSSGSYEGEFIAILEAFRLAHELALAGAFDRLVIFSDCQSVLKALAKNKGFPVMSSPALVYDMYCYAYALYGAGIEVELRWVPGHAGVGGNVRADKLAQRVRRLAQEIMADEAPGLVVKNVVTTTSSRESLRLALLGRWAHGIQRECGQRQESVFDIESQYVKNILDMFPAIPEYLRQQMLETAQREWIAGAAMQIETLLGLGEVGVEWWGGY